MANAKILISPCLAIEKRVLMVWISLESTLNIATFP
jgi:hypothetical protein